MISCLTLLGRLLPRSGSPPGRPPREAWRRGKLVNELKLLVRVRVWGWVRVMVEFGTSSAFRGWIRVRVLGYRFGVRGRKVKTRD